MARPDRKFWVDDVWLIACVLWLGLTFYWFFTFSGPFAALADLESKWTGGRIDGPVIVLAMIVAGAYAFTWLGRLLDRVLPRDPAVEAATAESATALAVPAAGAVEQSADHLTRAARKRKRHKERHDREPPTSPREHHAARRDRRGVFGRRESNWYFAAIIGGLGTVIMLVVAAWYAGVGLTRGPLTQISAAQLEGGAKPKSGWVEVSGVADLREAVEIAGQYKEHKWSATYVPLLGSRRDPAGHAEVFLCLEQPHESQFSSQAASFRGTVSLQTLPNHAWHVFETRGLHPDRRHIVVNFGQTPDELIGEAKDTFKVVLILAAATAVMALIGWVRTSQLRRR